MATTQCLASPVAATPDSVAPVGMWPFIVLDPCADVAILGSAPADTSRPLASRHLYNPLYGVDPFPSTPGGQQLLRVLPPCPAYIAAVLLQELKVTQLVGRLSAVYHLQPLAQAAQHRLRSAPRASGHPGHGPRLRERVREARLAGQVHPIYPKAHKLLLRGASPLQSWVWTPISTWVPQTSTLST